MRHALPLLVLVLLASCGPGETLAPGPGLNPDPRTVIGGDRPATVVLPSDYDIEQRYPLVVLLHGYGASALLQDVIFGLQNRVDPGQFVLVLPEGTQDPGGSQFWNASDQCCDHYGSDVDDVGYLTGLIDQALRVYAVDPEHVALVGHSNGGYMSYRLACEIPDRIDRVAVLAGDALLDPADCAVGDPVSVLHIHGTADTVVPYLPDPWHLGAEASVERWRERDGCDPDPTPLSDADLLEPPLGAETRRSRWGGCSPGQTVELWRVEGGDHTFLQATTEFRDGVTDWLIAP